jgi:hypothetical protein
VAIVTSRLRAALKKLPPLRRLLRQRDEAREQLAAAQSLVRELEQALAAQRAGTCYDHDGMRLFGKNTGFLREEAFARAYRAGMYSGHRLGRCVPGGDGDVHIEWRVHMACWAARHAVKLPGDFVECGVNTGILSLAICHYVGLNETGKTFYLFDTFKGIPEDQMLPAERDDRLAENCILYEECYEQARRNFAPFSRARLVRGKVPDTLTQVPIDKVCYLSLDMNIAYPEVAALEFFWDKLVSGAVVLLDDYGWSHYPEQYKAMNALAARKGVAIATLPTGQGLLLKP